MKQSSEPSHLITRHIFNCCSRQDRKKNPSCEHSPKDTQTAAQLPSIASSTPPETGISDHNKLGRITQVTPYSFPCLRAREQQQWHHHHWQEQNQQHHIQFRCPSPTQNKNALVQWWNNCMIALFIRTLFMVCLHGVHGYSNRDDACWRFRLLHTCILFSLSTALSPRETSVCKALQAAH